MYLGDITFKAFDKLMRLDEKLVGTKDYMGIAYFWGHEYKHSLRDATYCQRRKIHNMALAANVDPINKNKAMWKIIEKVLGKDAI